jgi:hypothetical protein
LHVEETALTGESVSIDFPFSLDSTNKSSQDIDSILIGDNSHDEQGNGNNSAGIDPSGQNPSAVTIPPGAIIPISNDVVPSLTFNQEDPDSAPEAAALGSTGPFAGGVYSVSLSSVNITDRGFDLTIAYDKNSAPNLKDMALYQFTPAGNQTLGVAKVKPTKGKWTAVPGVQTIDPLKGTVTVKKIHSLSSVLSVPKHLQALSDGKGYRPNGFYRTAGASTLDSGTFAIMKISNLDKAAPAVPAPVGSAQGVSSITWTWAAIKSADYYWLYPSTGGNPIAVNGNSYLMTGLSTNTAYGVKLSAVNTFSEGALSKTATTYTLTAAPSSLNWSGVYLSTITLTWQTNGNPSYTQYALWSSKNNASNGTMKPILPDQADVNSATFTVKSLSPGVTYYFHIQAINGSGTTGFKNPTTPDPTVTTSTMTWVKLKGGVLWPARFRLDQAKIAVARSRNRSTIVADTLITIAPLNDSARVQIYARRPKGAGVLVRELWVAANKVGWDGTDDQGRRVPRGAYYVLLADDQQRRLIKFTIRP